MSRREEDLRMLKVLLEEHTEELSEWEATAFAGMRFDLTAYEGVLGSEAAKKHGFGELTVNQRAAVEKTFARLVDETQNLVSRNLVPRGREVAPAPVLMHLPKAPPPMPKPVSRAPARSTRRHCGKEDEGCYAFVNGDCGCSCCR